MNRRDFVVAAGTAVASSRVLGANDRIRVALIGAGGRGSYVTNLVKQQAGAEIAGACDVYEPRRLEACEKYGAPCKAYADWRAVLDDKSIDAVVIGAPDHWHTPMVIAAVDSGKDVYCEKPVTHKLEEGEKLIAAVEKSKRVVATGTQQRAWEHYLLAKHLVEEGKIGKVTLAQSWWFQNYTRRPGGRPDSPIDASKLDWKAWLGPAPEQPFSLQKYRRWRWFWDFGGGAFTDLMTHWIDVIQWYMKSPKPVEVEATGSVHLNDWLECPDTVTASVTFAQYTATYQGTMTSSVEDGGIILRGTEGTMRLTRGGFAMYAEGTRAADYLLWPEPVMVVKSTGDGTRTNVANWLECVRSRKAPMAHVRAGVEAARTSQLANLAMRQKRIVAAG